MQGPLVFIIWPFIFCGIFISAKVTMTCRNNVFRNLRKLLCFASLLWLLSFILSLTSVYFCLIIITNISHSQPVEHCNLYLWPLNKTNKLLEINEELIYQAVLLRIINDRFQDM